MDNITMDLGTYLTLGFSSAMGIGIALNGIVSGKSLFMRVSWAALLLAEGAYIYDLWTKVSL